MAMNAYGVVDVLRTTLDNAGKNFSNAVGRSGASPLEKGRVGATAVGKIAYTRSALPNPANLEVLPVVLGQSAENKGKTILDHLSKGLDRMLLSINICIVLLRADGFDNTTVDSALEFVRELKVLYDALCASVTPGNTNNTKVNDVKGVLDALLAKSIPGDLIAALQTVGAPKRANDDGFKDYADEVTEAALATIKQPNVGNAARAAAATAQNPGIPANLAAAMSGVENGDGFVGNVGANEAAAAAAAQNAEAAAAAATAAAAAAAAAATAAAAAAANPELIGVLTRDGRDLTGVKYKLADNNGQPKLLDNFIKYQDNLYFISKTKNGALTNVAANTFYKVSKGSTNASYYVLNNTLNNNTTLFLYKLPIIKGGRRRTKAKSKRKTKRRSIRRNRRS
jgi:hypothetical protein